MVLFLYLLARYILSCPQRVYFCLIKLFLPFDFCLQVEIRVAALRFFRQLICFQPTRFNDGIADTCVVKLLKNYVDPSSDVSYYAISSLYFYLDGLVFVYLAVYDLISF